MENKSDIQLQFFQRVHDQLPDHISMVEEIADILEISNDSAYRRIRGEKPLSLQEVQRLAITFNISLDDITGGNSSTITFRTNLLDGERYSFTEWLKQLLQFTIEAGKSGPTDAIFILNELNIFNIIQFPVICAFKLFFWQKSNLDFTDFRDAKFSAGEINEEVLLISNEITDRFLKINTIEFTTQECLNSFLKQVTYYSEAGYFSTRNDALVLCQKLHELLDHQQKQAELGYKFLFGHSPSGREGNLQLFHNDIILADNTIIIKSGESGAIFITSNAINLMYTYNRAFFDYNYRWGMNLLKKSVPISGTAEKERNRFFRFLHEQVDSTADRL